MKRMIQFYSLLIALHFYILNPSLYADNGDWVQYAYRGTIFCVAEGEEVMWVGTNVGLVVIDKVTDKTEFYNTANADLPGNTVNVITTDGEGTAWSGTNNIAIKQKEKPCQ